MIVALYRQQPRHEDDRLRRGGPGRRLRSCPRDRPGHLPAGRRRAGLHPVEDQAPRAPLTRRRQGRRAASSPPSRTSRTLSRPTPRATPGRSRVTATPSPSPSRSRATTRQPRRRSTPSSPPPPRPRRRTPSYASSSSATPAPARPSRRCSRPPQEGRVDLAPDHARILLLAFGALVAAGLPLLLASPPCGGHGPRAARQPALARDRGPVSVVMLVGLAVGVDYSLFYIRREREERARAATPTRRSTPRRRPPAAPCSSPA